MVYHKSFKIPLAVKIIKTTSVYSMMQETSILKSFVNNVNLKSPRADIARDLKRN